jgi:hypothetical protein
MDINTLMTLQERINVSYERYRRQSDIYMESLRSCRTKDSISDIEAVGLSISLGFISATLHSQFRCWISNNSQLRCFTLVQRYNNVLFAVNTGRSLAVVASLSLCSAHWLRLYPWLFLMHEA